MTIRVDDESAAFVDRAVSDGEGTRAAVINRALRREMRRRRAEQDAAIYTTTTDPDLDSDAYTARAEDNAISMLRKLD